jgi:hypothetical protein
MPVLTIIAGCNGAGKSKFAPSFLPEGLFSFDYDKLFLENYNQLPDSELREEFARNKTTILQIKNGKLFPMTKRFPDYFSRRFPDIIK